MRHVCDVPTMKSALTPLPFGLTLSVSPHLGLLRRNERACLRNISVSKSRCSPIASLCLTASPAPQNFCLRMTGRACKPSTASSTSRWRRRRTQAQVRLGLWLRGEAYDFSLPGDDLA
jgi:hypothetical protein